MNLLIIEENAAMCRLIRALVEGLPLSITECRHGSQALAVCAQVQPDWILLDLNLARADALAAAQRIRATSPQARVVLLAEEDSTRLQEAALQAGACGYLLKDNLIEVRRLLEASP